MAVVHCDAVYKTYTSPRWRFWNDTAVPALRGVSFSVEDGEIFGIVGPNGAGKSTLINILSGLVYRDAGTVELFGQDIQRHREAVTERMNVATAYSMLNGRLTVEENLRVFGKLYGVEAVGPRIEELLDLFELRDKRDSRVDHMSAGQKTRANLCKAFINEPELLLLDEATAGLDPHIAARTREAIAALNADHGTTIVITSHNMTDIDALSDRMLFLHQGEVLRQGTPRDLKRDIHVKVLEVAVDRVTTEFEQLVADRGGALEDGVARFALESESAIMDVLDAVRETGVDVIDIEAQSPELDTLFAELAEGRL